jgi:hypothetical protein
MIDLGEPINKYHFIFQRWKYVESRVMLNQQRMMDEYKRVEDENLTEIQEILLNTMYVVEEKFNVNRFRRAVEWST